MLYACNVLVQMLVFKRYPGIPVVYVTYLAVFEMKDVLPSNCDNVLIRLRESSDMVKEIFTNFCNDLFINTTMNFTYSTLAFPVNITKTFTSFNLIRRYEFFSILYLYTQTVVSMFKGVTCDDSTPNYSVHKALYIQKRYE